MSIFSGQTTTETGNTESSNNQNYIEEVVKLKGETFKDPAEIAKGYLNAQEHIQNLEAQAEEMRKAIEKQDYAKSLLEELNRTKGEQSHQAQAGQETQGGVETEDTTPKFNADEIKSLVEKTLGELSVAEQRQANLSAVESKLAETYGDKANSVVEEKAGELGMTKEKLQSLAEESPVAFLNLFGVENKAKQGGTNTTIPSSTNTNADNFNTPSKRDFAYYQKLRRENERLYFSSKTQEQMFKDRKELGEAFYS